MAVINSWINHYLTDLPYFGALPDLGMSNTKRWVVNFFQIFRSENNSLRVNDVKKTGENVNDESNEIGSLRKSGKWKLYDLSLHAFLTWQDVCSNAIC